MIKTFTKFQSHYWTQIAKLEFKLADMHLRPPGYKAFLYSTEHEIYPAHNC